MTTKNEQDEDSSFFGFYDDLSDHKATNARITRYNKDKHTIVAGIERNGIEMMFEMNLNNPQNIQLFAYENGVKCVGMSNIFVEDWEEKGNVELYPAIYCGACEKSEWIGSFECNAY